MYENRYTTITTGGTGMKFQKLIIKNIASLEYAEIDFVSVLQSLRKGVVKKPVPRTKSTISIQDPLGNSPILRPEVYLEAFKMTDKNLTDSTIDI